MEKSKDGKEKGDNKEEETRRVAQFILDLVLPFFDMWCQKDYPKAVLLSQDI